MPLRRPALAGAVRGVSPLPLLTVLQPWKRNLVWYELRRYSSPTTLLRQCIKVKVVVVIALRTHTGVPLFPLSFDLSRWLAMELLCAEVVGVGRVAEWSVGSRFAC